MVVVIGFLVGLIVGFGVVGDGGDFCVWVVELIFIGCWLVFNCERVIGKKDGVEELKVEVFNCVFLIWELLFEIFGLFESILFDFFDNVEEEELEGCWEVEVVVVCIMLCLWLIVVFLFLLNFGLEEGFDEWLFFFDIVGEFGGRGEFGRWYIFEIVIFIVVFFEEFELFENNDFLFYFFGDFIFDCGGGEEDGELILDW